MFCQTFNCTLQEAIDAVEEIESGGNYHLEHYRKQYYNHIAPKRHRIKPGYIALFIFILIIIVSTLFLVLLFCIPDFILPTLRFQTVAVELPNGELFETRFTGNSIGVFTRKGEYLVEYDAGALAGFVALYLAPYYDSRDSGRVGSGTVDIDGWEIKNGTNPWFNGVLRDSGGVIKTFYTSEMVYHSPTSYHYESALYDTNGTVVWSYDNREKLSAPYTQRTTVGYSKMGSGVNPVDFFLPNCINIHKFMAEVYGINVETVYDKENRLIIFKVPKEAIVMYNGD